VTPALGAARPPPAPPLPCRSNNCLSTPRKEHRMTQQKSIPQIRQEFTAKLVAAQHARDARIEEITAKRRPEGDGPLLDRLDDAQRAKLLLEQKVAAAEGDRRRLLDELGQEHAAYKAAVQERTGSLREKLFRNEEGEKAELLARLATASQDELGSMLSVAAETGNKALGRAVFATAHRRDIPELLVRYFGEIDPSARDLYGELNEAPTPEVLDRQRGDLATLIAPVPENVLDGVLRPAAY
jgi:hypothetical protein